MVFGSATVVSGRLTRKFPSSTGTLMTCRPTSSSASMPTTPLSAMPSVSTSPTALSNTCSTTSTRIAWCTKLRVWTLRRPSLRVRRWVKSRLLFVISRMARTTLTSSAASSLMISRTVCSLPSGLPSSLERRCPSLMRLSTGAKIFAMSASLPMTTRLIWLPVLQRITQRVSLPAMALQALKLFLIRSYGLGFLLISATVEEIFDSRKK
mmetsp:Transcript_31557/g.64233  ORF Transcript_31557/g.64233 Transcript_31557/m.64233 type:complete len:209 (+) Transcript_31557:407-1033(+)